MTDNATPMPGTALPWEARTEFGSLCIVDGEGDYIADIYDRETYDENLEVEDEAASNAEASANAAYIVWACNNAGALLGELVAALEKIATNRPDGKCKAGTTCRTIARAALAKARQQ